MSHIVFVAIVHYHLRPGGVTQIIEHAVTALENENCKLVILTGEKPQSDSRLIDKTRVVNGLGYSETSFNCDPAILAERLMAEARHALGRTPDIWHFHNHSLGKNCALTEAVRLLAIKGCKILLQIHDFAEDGRPSLFKNLVQHIGNGKISELGEHVYPQADHIHYAAINRHDHILLARTGIPAHQLHLLANPVALCAETSSLQKQSSAELSSERQENMLNHTDGRLFLYCTRAIRRKNIGEFILWASLKEPFDRYGITLAPINPAQRPIYEQWVDFAKDCGIQVEFELGKGKPLPALLKSAYATVTTSISEGFGLAFLEPWLARRPVYGRKLPEITDEFETAGVNLSHFYHQLLVPVRLVNKKILLKKISTRLGTLMAAYGRILQPGDAEKALEAASDTDRIDFGRLDEELQQKIIQKVAGAESFKQELQPSDIVTTIPNYDMIEHNCEAVKSSFSLESYGRRLMNIMSKLQESNVERVNAGLDVNKLLDEFISPDQFYLLKS